MLSIPMTLPLSWSLLLNQWQVQLMLQVHSQLQLRLQFLKLHRGRAAGASAAWLESERWRVAPIRTTRTQTMGEEEEKSEAAGPRRVGPTKRLIA